MKKIGIVTQARMTSTRLPAKILKEAGGKSLLQHHIERLSWSGFPICIATTINKTDNVIEDFAIKLGLNFYRGDEANVLSRYYECAKKYEFDILVRVTSDCPLIDGYLIKEAVEKYLEWDNENIYYSNCIIRTFPRGFDFEIFSFQSLEDAFFNATLETHLEHVTPYINQNISGKIILKHFIQPENDSSMRITVDTVEDFDLVHLLIEKHHCATMRGYEIISLFHKFPELKLINEHIEQKKI